MRKGFSAITVLASAAFAFAPGHLVVTEEAVVYDEDHNYEDDYIIARLPYWTEVEAEWVGPPQSPRTYCLVTLADGRRGKAEWDYFGRAFIVVAEEAPLLGVPAVEKTKVAAVEKGEIVAQASPPATDENKNVTWFQVVAGGGESGWIEAGAVRPVVPQAGDFDPP